jgi:hypothetical protein
MFRAFALIIRSTRPRLAAYCIQSYLQMGGGVKSRHLGRVYRAPHRTHRPDPAFKLSINLYDVNHCCVYSEKLLMMDRETVRNM